MTQTIIQKTNQNTTTRTSENHCYITIDGYEYRFQNTGLYINFLQELEMRNEDIAIEIKDNIVIGYLCNLRILEAKIVKVAKYGVFIQTKDEALKGLIHEKDLKNSIIFYKFGQYVNVRIKSTKAKGVNKIRYSFLEG